MARKHDGDRRPIARRLRFFHGQLPHAGTGQSASYFADDARQIGCREESRANQSTGSAETGKSRRGLRRTRQEKFAGSGIRARTAGTWDLSCAARPCAPFEKFAFSAKPKEISDLVTTEYGYHIIQVVEKEPARVKPFEEVKDSIAEQLKKQGVNDKMQATVDQARAALLKAPGSGGRRRQAVRSGINDGQGFRQPATPIPSLGASPEISAARAEYEAQRCLRLSAGAGKQTRHRGAQ